MSALITINQKHELNLPGSFDELSERELELLAPYIVAKPTIEIKIKVLSILMQSRLSKRARRLVAKGSFEGDELAAVGRLLDWIWQEPDGKRPVSAWVPGFKYKGIYYQFPEQDFKDVSFGEFEYIDMYLKHLSKIPMAKNPQAFEDGLRALLATIARPKKSKQELEAFDFDGLERVPFTVHNIKRFNEAQADCPDWLLWCAFDFCGKMKIHIQKKYARLFEGQKSEGASFGWLGLRLSVAESGTFGDEDKVRAKLFHTICIYAIKKKIEFEKAQRELEQSKQS